MPAARKRSRETETPVRAGKPSLTSIEHHDPEQPREIAEREFYEKHKRKKMHHAARSVNEAVESAMNITQPPQRPVKREERRTIRKADRIKERETAHQTEENADARAEEEEIAIAETALQAVRDNEAPIRLNHDDVAMGEALKQSENRLAALEGQAGAAAEAPRAGLDLRRGKNEMSDVWQPEKPAFQQDTVSEEEIRNRREKNRPRQPAAAPDNGHSENPDADENPQPQHPPPPMPGPGMSE